MQVEWSPNDLEHSFLLNGFLVNPDTSCSHPMHSLLGQEKASAEIRGEFFRIYFWANLGGDFRVDVSGAFSLERKENTQKKCTAQFKSNFGSFAAKLHTARIWP